MESSAGLLAEALLAYDGGRLDDALASAEAGMRLATTDHERFDLQRIGMLALHRLGRTRDAFELAEELLPRSPATGSASAVADIAAIAAGLADQLGEGTLAIDRLSLALDRLAEVDPGEPGFLRASNNIANSLLRFGAYHAAAEVLNLAGAHDTGDDRITLLIRFNLAVAELRVAEAPGDSLDPIERTQRLERVLDLTSPHLDDPLPRRRVDAAMLAAGAMLGLGRVEEAERLVARAERAAGEVHDTRAITDLELVRSRVLSALGKLDAAAVAANRAVLGAELADDPVLMARALRQRSLVFEAAGDTASALADLRLADARSLARNLSRYDSLLRQVQHRAALRAARRDAEARASTLEESVASLQELVNHDHLTGLPNRRAFDADAARRARRTGVIMADIDRFKSINDARGHLVGDGVLQLVARTLTSVLRERGVAYRWGGEEFLVVVGDEHALDTPAIADELRGAIAGAAWFSVGPGLRVTMSVGVAVGRADQLWSLVGDADHALYQAKAGGRDQVAIAST